MKGVLGTLEARARANEEQGRKSLHSHWQLWIKGINGYRTHFYHKDDAVKSKARKTFLGYVDKVMTATYGDDFIITDNCDCSNDGPVVAKKAKAIFKECELQVLTGFRVRPCWKIKSSQIARFGTSSYVGYRFKIVQ